MCFARRRGVILPGTGRGTMHSMVEGSRLKRGQWSAEVEIFLTQRHEDVAPGRYLLHCAFAPLQFWQGIPGTVYETDPGSPLIIAILHNHPLPMQRVAHILQPRGVADRLH